MPSSVSVYDTSDVAVKYRAGNPTRPLVVTFDPRRPEASHTRRPFGARFLAKAGYPAVHVTIGSNHWYQSPGMEGALDVIAGIAKDYDRVVTYGSSMGGHAALLFAGRLGAEAIAFSPLYSNSAGELPFPPRFPDDEYVHDPLRYPPEMMRGARGYAIFDPFSNDHRHMRLITQHADLTLIPLPFSSHPSTIYLADIGLLSTLVQQMIERQPVDLKRARALRRRSPRYWRSISIAARHRGRATLALRAALRAARVAPDDALIRETLALAKAMNVAARVRERQALRGPAPNDISHDPA